MWKTGLALAQAMDGPGISPDGGWMGTMGTMGMMGMLITHWLIWLVVLGLVVAGAFFLIRMLQGGGPSRPERRSALDLLDDRYARGEIGREEYLERKKDLS